MWVNNKPSPNIPKSPFFIGGIDHSQMGGLLLLFPHYCSFCFETYFHWFRPHKYHKSDAPLTRRGLCVALGTAVSYYMPGPAPWLHEDDDGDEGDGDIWSWNIFLKHVSRGLNPPARSVLDLCFQIHLDSLGEPSFRFRTVFFGYSVDNMYTWYLSWSLNIIS
jgi:hypothetical protein